MAEQKGTWSGNKGNNFGQYQQWKANLDSVVKDLNSLGSVTEQQFLAIGRELGTFYKRAEKIGTDCSSVVKDFSSEGTSNIISQAQGLIDRMSQYLHESELEFTSGVAMLAEVQQTVPKIDKHLGGFRKMIKNLEILSIAIKIESAQLKDGHDFVTIADDVEKLSVLIKSRIADIIARVRSLSILADHTLITIRSLEGKQKERALSIVGNTSTVISSIGEKNRSSAAAASSIASEAEQLTQNISEVVSSIQFHDITRQQIEHVAEALSEGAEVVGKTRDDDNPEHPEARNTILSARAVCRLQNQHLKDATKKFSDAVNNIVASLEGIANNTTEVCEWAQSLVGSSGGSSASSLAAIGEDLSSVVTFLGEIKMGIRDLSSAVDGLSSTASDMAKFVDDIEEIGAEIELIAVNARIKAAHTGAEGAPLGVIAEVIQRLSVEARTQKTAISEELRQIVGTVDRLHEEVNLDSEERTSETNSLTNDLQILLQDLNKADEATMRSLASIQKESGDLARDIDEAAGSLTVHRSFSTVIEDSINRLDAIIEQSMEILPNAEEAENSDTLSYLEKNYTMHSERVIHRAHTAARAGARKGGASETTISGGMTSPKDHFSNNVELFS
jgi:methyl-accepting chemotaxis protein